MRTILLVVVALHGVLVLLLAIALATLGWRAAGLFGGLTGLVAAFGIYGGLRTIGSQSPLAWISTEGNLPNILASWRLTKRDATRFK